MKIKAIIQIEATKPDMYGNTYRAGTVTNARTGKSTPYFQACSEGNVLSVLRSLLNVEHSALTCSESCTGSARLSSLPDHEHLRLPAFAKELRKIGFSVPAERLKTCRCGCL